MGDFKGIYKRKNRKFGAFQKERDEYVKSMKKLSKKP